MAYTKDEWVPDYLQTARERADRAVPEQALEASDAVALAIRELAAEVRALRHVLCGSHREPPTSTRQTAWLTSASQW